MTPKLIESSIAVLAVGAARRSAVAACGGERRAVAAGRAAR